MQKVYCRAHANIPVWRASPGDSASPVIRNRRHAEDEARRRRFLTHEGLAFSTLKIRPAGLAVVNRRAGEHVDCLDCGDRHRPGREHANRGQLTLAGARVGGKGQDNLSCAVMTTQGALATITSCKLFSICDTIGYSKLPGILVEYCREIPGIFYNNSIIYILLRYI